MGGFKAGAFATNPYVPRYPMPPYGQPMKTPEQYQADILRQLQPNIDMYSQQYGVFQQQQNVMNNSGQYVKVSSYDEVKQIQAPSDGRPIIIIDDTNGFLYSKKFENGQEYIKSFRLEPNEIKEEKVEKAASEPATPNNKDDLLNQILEKLNGFDARLNNLEGKSNGTNGNVAQ